jgi:hypothetical protein
MFIERVNLFYHDEPLNSTFSHMDNRPCPRGGFSCIKGQNSADRLNNGRLMKMRRRDSFKGLGVLSMMDILDYISTWSVLQWVVLVLIAGFIGQFGRMMAEAIIAKVRLRRANQHQLPDDEKPPEVPTVLPVDVSPIELPRKPAVSVEISDKKAVKAMAKARKKEAKKN